MPSNAERTPRKRPDNNSNRRGQASERKRTPRAKTSDRERAASRARTSERQRDSSRTRARTPERQRDSSRARARTPERQRDSARTRARATSPARTSPARTSERRRAPRSPAPVRRRAPRRGRAARPSFLSRAAVAALLILAVSFIGNRFFFPGLQVIGKDAPVETSMSGASDNRTGPDGPDDDGSAKSGGLPPDTPDDFSGAAPDNGPQRNRKSGFYNILLLGTDDHNGGSDTIILMSVDSQNNRIFGLSVPRDTKAVIDGKAYKINAAYKIGGSALLADTLSDQFGIPVDYTVEVNLEGFAALIDALGGVEFDVPIDMDYEDPAQDLTIKVSKGVQRLDGATALKVVRFRHNSDGTGYPDEDLGRIRTQQNFLKTAAKRMFSFSTLTKLDDFVRIFKKYVKTNLTLTDLGWLARKAIHVGTDHLQFATLPGEWRNPYIYPDPQKTLAFVNEYLNPYETDRTLSDLHLPQ